MRTPRLVFIRACIVVVAILIRLYLLHVSPGAMQEKLPALITEFFLGFELAAIVQRFAGKGAATQALAILLLTPILWFANSDWGRTEALAALTLVLAIRAALSERYYLMWVFAGISVFLQPQHIITIPMLWIFQGFRSRNHLQRIAGPLLCLCALDFFALPIAPNARPDLALLWLLGRDAAALSPYLIALAFAVASIAFVFFRLRAVTLQVASRDAWSISLIVLVQGITIALLAFFLFIPHLKMQQEISAIVLLPLLSIFSPRERAAAIALGLVFCIRIVAGIFAVYDTHHYLQTMYVAQTLLWLNIVAFSLLVFQAWQSRMPQAHEQHTG